MDWFIKIATIARAAGPYVGPVLELVQLAMRAKDPEVTEESIELAIKAIDEAAAAQRAREDAVWEASE